MKYRYFCHITFDFVKILLLSYKYDIYMIVFCSPPKTLTSETDYKNKIN